MSLIGPALYKVLTQRSVWFINTENWTKTQGYRVVRNCTHSSMRKASIVCRAWTHCERRCAKSLERTLI